MKKQTSRHSESEVDSLSENVRSLFDDSIALAGNPAIILFFFLCIIHNMSQLSL